MHVPTRLGCMRHACQMDRPARMPARYAFTFPIRTAGIVVSACGDCTYVPVHACANTTRMSNGCPMNVKWMSQCTRMSHACQMDRPARIPTRSAFTFPIRTAGQRFVRTTLPPPLLLTTFGPCLSSPFGSRSVFSFQHARAHFLATSTTPHCNSGSQHRGSRARIAFENVRKTMSPAGLTRKTKAGLTRPDSLGRTHSKN